MISLIHAWCYIDWSLGWFVQEITWNEIHDYTKVWNTIYNIHLVLKRTPIFPFRHILKILYHYIFGLSQISKKKRFPNLSMEISCRYIHFIQTFKIMGSPHSLPLSCVDRNLSQKILTAWWEVQLHFDGGFNTIQIQFQMVSHFYRCFGLLNFCEKVVSSGCRNPSKVADTSNIQTPPSTSFWKLNNF